MKLTKSLAFLTLLAPLLWVSACENKKSTQQQTAEQPAAAAAPADTVRQPVVVILDTDIGPDVDDVGAMALLHAFADQGEARILGVVSCNPNRWTAPLIDVLNTYFGRPEIPIGAPKNGGVKMDNMYGYNEAVVPRYPHQLKSTDDAPDAVALYRKLLASQPDSSVTIITVGFLTNLRHLLASPKDSLSELDGKQLVAQKVKHLVSMGGKFPQGKEFNLELDAPAAQAVISEWPTPIVFSGFEIGENVLTGNSFLKDSTLVNSPVKDAFVHYLQKDKKPSRPSWDQTAVLAAVRGFEPYFSTESGQCRMFPDGHNEWQADPQGRHRILKFAQTPEQLAAVIEELMRHQPGQPR